MINEINYLKLRIIGEGAASLPWSRTCFYRSPERTNSFERTLHVFCVFCGHPNTICNHPATTHCTLTQLTKTLLFCLKNKTNGAFSIK